MQVACGDSRVYMRSFKMKVALPTQFQTWQQSVN